MAKDRKVVYTLAAEAAAGNAAVAGKIVSQFEDIARAANAAKQAMSGMAFGVGARAGGTSVTRSAAASAGGNRSGFSAGMAAGAKAMADERKEREKNLSDMLKQVEREKKALADRVLANVAASSKIRAAAKQTRVENYKARQVAEQQAVAEELRIGYEAEQQKRIEIQRTAEAERKANTESAKAAADAAKARESFNRKAFSGFKQFTSGITSIGRALQLLNVAGSENIEAAVRGLAQFEAVAQSITGALNTAQGAWKMLGAVANGAGKGGLIGAGVAGMTALGVGAYGHFKEKQKFDEDRATAVAQYRLDKSSRAAQFAAIQDAGQRRAALSAASSAITRDEILAQAGGLPLFGKDTRALDPAGTTARLAKLNEHLGEGSKAAFGYRFGAADAPLTELGGAGLAAQRRRAEAGMRLAEMGQGLRTADSGEVIRTWSVDKETAASEQTRYAQDLLEITKQELAIRERARDVISEQRAIAYEAGQKSLEAARAVTDKIREQVNYERERLKVIQDQTKDSFARYADLSTEERTRANAAAEKAMRGATLTREDEDILSRLGESEIVQQSKIARAKAEGVEGSAFGRLRAQTEGRQQAIAGAGEVGLEVSIKNSQQMVESLNNKLSEGFDKQLNAIAEVIAKQYADVDRLQALVDQKRTREEYERQTAANAASK